MPQTVQETACITEAAAAGLKKTGLMLVQHITPGWGSSGYYSSEVLEQAAADVVIPKGTHMYADHPTETEARERPVRSIKDLMAVTTEDARLATDDDIAVGAELGALVSEVRVMAPYRPLIEDLADTIGTSIRGDGELYEGEAEGRTGRIIESLVHVTSTDFVTRAGRGGRVLSLLESARVNQRVIERGVSESTANDTRETLQNLVRDAHASDDVWVWVRDFDPETTTVWFDIESGDDAGTYAQTYTASTDGAVVELTGDRELVRPVTTYVPVARPGSTTPTKESEEDTMPNIEESELRRLREDAGRVTALEERATTAEARAETAESALSESRRTGRARSLITARALEAEVDFDDLQVRGLMADLPVTEAGELDEARFTTTVDEQAAALKTRAGAGTVVGHGSSAGSSSTGISWDDIDEAAGLKTKEV